MSGSYQPAVGIFPTTSVKVSPASSSSSTRCQAQARLVLLQDVAESLAIDKISEETCQAIAGDVEYRLNLIIQEAHKFMRHAKRTTMMPEDIDYALQALNVQVRMHGMQASSLSDLPRPSFVVAANPSSAQTALQTSFPARVPSRDGHHRFKSSAVLPERRGD